MRRAQARSSTTNPLPCIGLSDSNYILTLIFFEENNHKHLKKKIKEIDLQSQAIYVDKCFFKKIRNILEEGASSVQVDIEST